MNKIGIHFGPHIPRHDKKIVELIHKVYHGAPGVALVMEGSEWIANIMPSESIVIQRLNYMFEHLDLTFSTEATCYDWGRRKAKAIVESGLVHIDVTHVMGICEPKFEDVMDGRKLGAFDAGLADVFIEYGIGYCALNISMGKGESGSTPSHKHVIEGYAQSFSQWSDFYDLAFAQDKWNLIWGYHMYSNGVDADKWLGNRPWVFWEPDLEYVGIVMPEIVGTEAGYDPPLPEHLARYITDWPQMHKKALGGCFYGVRMGEHWERFDYERDEAVINAMAITNKEEGEPEVVDKNYEKGIDELWRPIQWNKDNKPAFYKEWLRNIGDLGFMVGQEFDFNGRRYQRCEFGFIYAIINDWGNVKIALCREDMPNPLV